MFIIPAILLGAVLVEASSLPQATTVGATYSGNTLHATPTAPPTTTKNVSPTSSVYSDTNSTGSDHPTHTMSASPSATTVDHSASASATVSSNVQPTDVVKKEKPREWGVFDKSVLIRDQERIADKYKYAKEWLKGVGIGKLPDFTFVDIPDDLSLLNTRYGVEPLTNYARDTLYYGDSSIGSSGQVLTVDVDTGSADLWVQSGCPDCAGPQYSPAKSKTFRTEGKGFNIQYGSGSATGTQGRDVVTIAGVTVRDQVFGLVNKPSDEFKKSPTGGLIGMAFSTIASTRQPTFFENAMRASPTLNPIFSVFLSRKQASGSQLCLGCYDSSKVHGGSGVTWLPVVSRTYWAVSMTGVLVNSDVVQSKKSIVAAIDTGTTLLYVPEDVAEDVYSNLRGAERTSSGYYTLPCKTFEKLHISLVFDKIPFMINMIDFNLGRVSSGSDICVAGLLGLGDGFPDNLAIVGDEFLKSWYSTYDYSNGVRVGLSRSIN